MSKKLTVVTLILSVLFEVCRIAADIQSIYGVNSALSEINGNNQTAEVLMTSMKHSCLEIAVCCVLIVLSVVSCVVLFKRKHKV